MHQVITLSPETVSELQMSSLEPTSVKLSELLQGKNQICEISQCLKCDI